ncbi:MAG: class I SAM-dependent methyltransferase [Myxococcota bacterium]
MNSTLEDPRVSATLDRLHGRARGDWKHFVATTPRILWSVLKGQGLLRGITPAHLKSAYIPVSREGGRFLYSATRAAGARTVVEFGTSFGISTIYLAAAVRDNGGGTVFTCEVEPSKCQAARENFKAAGVDDVVTLLEGDALTTLEQVPAPVDFVFLDGWKHLYVPVLELLKARLRAGAVVLADNTNLPDLRPYVSKVNAATEPFVTTRLFGRSMAYSVYTGVTAR